VKTGTNTNIRPHPTRQGNLQGRIDPGEDTHYCRQFHLHLRDATRYRSNTVALLSKKYAFLLFRSIRQNLQLGMGGGHPGIGFYVN